ncbi:GyrI-like domain-containing protein [Carnobacterium sp.]|uniref:GyrI-like domain-containing protein n=1 Tax=Carnobacterium sp. TaxID=48221 RepID=UPI003C72765F
MQEVKKYRLFNQRYGIMLSTKKIEEGDFDTYDYYYSIVEEKQGSKSVFTKPAGDYIQIFSKGNWDQLPSVYVKIKEFSKDNGLRLLGYSYEEGINEMAISNLDDYITQILIRYEII